MAPFTTEVEFDELNKISLTRVGGRLANESLADLYAACQKHSSDTHASVSIVDLSSVSECALSYQFIQRLAERKPAIVDGRHRCFIVAPAGHIYGLCRMFQILAEMTRPLLEVVHTLGEAFAAIAIHAAQFEPTSAPAPFKGLSAVSPTV
jgi:hypothetical protein